MLKNVSSPLDDPIIVVVDDGDLFEMDEATPPEDPRASTLTDGRDGEVTLEEPTFDDGEFSGVFHRDCIPMNFRGGNDTSDTTGIFTSAQLIALKLGVSGRARRVLQALGLN